MKKIATLFIFIAFITALYCVYSVYSRRDISRLPGVTDPMQVADIEAYPEDNPGLGFDIRAFKKDGVFILFLPVRVDESSLVFYILDSEGNALDRVAHDFSSEGEYLICGALPVKVMRSDLPSLEISLVKGTLDEVEESKDQLFRAGGDMVLSCSDEMAGRLGCETVVKSRDREYSLPGSLELWGHGNASWLLDKKSYDIKLETWPEILDMGSGDRWVLLANAIDLTLLRNEVFLDMADKCSLPYTPKLRHVDLFVDGEYRGCYSLAQKVETGEERVAIIPGRDYFYRWGLPGRESDKVPADPGDTRVVYQLPRLIFRDKLTNVVELKDVGDVFSSREALDIAFDTMDAVADTDSDRYLDRIDVKNWARYYWVQEFSKNTDATSRSLYTFWEGDEKRMVMGPVWDMDQTAGVEEPFDRPADYIYPTEWAVRCEEWYVPLFEHKSFSEVVNEVYRDEDLAAVFAHCIEEIPERAAAVRRSAEMNFIRWDCLDEPQNNQIVRYMGQSTIDTQVEWLYQWCLQRLEWIETQQKGS